MGMQEMNKETRRDICSLGGDLRVADQVASSPNPEPRTDDFKGKEKQKSSAIQNFYMPLYFHKDF